MDELPFLLAYLNKVATRNLYNYCQAFRIDRCDVHTKTVGTLCL
jgi:hypothetical protein